MLFAPAEDRRRSRRHWISVPVIIRNGETRVDGLSINIGDGGMYLFAAAYISPGTRIVVEYRQPNGDGPTRAIGAIRRRALYLYAVEFLTDAAPADDRTAVQGINQVAL